MITPKAEKALSVLESFRDGVTAKEFAHALWPDSPGWRKVANQGNGATSGKGMWLAAGSYLEKLRKQGLAISIQDGPSKLWFISSKGATELNCSRLDTLAREEKAMYEEIDLHNRQILDSIPCASDEIESLLGGMPITDKIEFVDGPEGSRQNEDCGIFEDIHVDQQSFCDSGDSYSGKIYARIPGGRWISVPFYE